MSSETILTKSEAQTSGEVDKDRNGSRMPVLFIHGFLDEGSIWDNVAESLDKAGYVSRTVDLLGMGNKFDASGPFTLDRLAAAVASELDELGAPAVLVGHSMGTQVAELVAVQRPQQVLGMLLISPVPLGGMEVPDEIANAMRALGRNGESQAQLRRQFAVEATDQLIDKLTQSGLKPLPATVSAFFDTWSTGHDVGQSVTTFEGPVAIAGDDQDGFSTPELVATVIAPRFPQASPPSFISRAGHWPHAEQPAATAELVEGFIASLALEQKPVWG